jgi:hypothetical protein
MILGFNIAQRESRAKSSNGKLTSKQKSSVTHQNTMNQEHMSSVGPAVLPFYAEKDSVVHNLGLGKLSSRIQNDLVL